MKSIKLYAVYDVVAERFNPCFIATNDIMAIRMFKASIEKNNQNLSEFRLYSCGAPICEAESLEELNDFDCLVFDGHDDSSSNFSVVDGDNSKEDKSEEKK